MNKLEDLEMDNVFSFNDDEEPSSGSLTSSSASSDTPEITPVNSAASATTSGMSGNERAMFLKLMENQQQLQEMLMATVQNQSRPGKTRRVYPVKPRNWELPIIMVKRAFLKVRLPISVITDADVVIINGQLPIMYEELSVLNE